MAMTTQAIRELTIRARAEGVQQVTQALDGMAQAQREVAASGEQMAKTTDTSARRQQSAAAGLRRVEAQLDGAIRATRAYEAQVRQLDRALDQGLISQTRYAEVVKQAQAQLTVATVQARTRMQMQAANANDMLGIGDAPEKVKLTAQQMTGLGYQINDVATMLAMGASPFQVISSQAGQVVQVLGEGPGGMRGSLAAIGNGLMSLITPTTAVAAALLAAGSAAVYFATRGESKIRPLNEAMESHRKIIGDIAESYGAAITARDSYASGATRAFSLRQSADALRLSARSSLLDNGFAGSDRLRLHRTEDGGRSYEARDEFKAFEGPLVKLAQGLRSGTDDARAFIDEVAKIANLTPANEALQKTAKKLQDLAQPAADAKDQLDALADAMVRLRETRIGDAFERFGEYLPDTEGAREQIQRSYAERLSAIGQLGGADRGRAEGMRVAAANDLRKALAEVERQESVIREGRSLDLREVGARTTAERASIAAERERLALSGEVLTDTERAARIQHASDLVFVQDQQAATDALRERQRARGDMLTSLQNEFETLGMTRGAAEAYRREQEMILALYREAEDAGRVVDPAEVEEIRRVTAAAGALTDQLERLKMVREQQEQLRGLNLQAGLIGGSDDAVRQATAVYEMQRKLREQGYDLNSDFAKGQVANARALSDYGDQIRRQSEAWDDLRGAGESAIDSLVDGLASGTADIGDLLKGIVGDLSKAFLELAVANPLKNMLFGTNYGTLSDLLSGAPKAPSLSSAGASAFGTVSMTAAVVNLNGSPLGLGGLAGGAGSEGGAMGAINKLLGSSGGEAAKLGSNGLVPVSDVAAYIRTAATARGIDPDTALKVARSEGLGAGIWQSNFTRGGNREPSFGPFQLLKGGRGTGFPTGMGNDFMSRTGLDPADPKNTFAGVDFALDHAAKNGWGAWYGAKRVGVGNREGLGGARAKGVDLSSAERSFDKINDSAAKMASSATSAASSVSSGLVGSVGDFVSGFGMNSKIMIDGMEGTVGDFLPKFGNNLSSLLDAVSGGGKGSGGGLLSQLVSGISGRTGISSAGVSASLGNVGGLRGFFADGGYTGFGARDDIAGIVHAGEYVIPKHMVDRIGVGALERQYRGYADGGYVGPGIPDNVIPFSSKSAPAASAPTITVINQTGVKAEAEVKTRPDGSLELTLSRKVAEEIGTRGRPANNLLRRGFGLDQTLKRR